MLCACGQADRERVADQEMALLHDIPLPIPHTQRLGDESPEGSETGASHGYVRQRGANGSGMLRGTAGALASGSGRPVARGGESQPRCPAAADRLLPARADDPIIDLRAYMNTSAPSVLDTFSVERAYMMFRTLGLRHLVVVDAVNHVVGIIARQVRCAASPSEPCN